MKILLAIGTGSFIGGILRYLISHLINTRTLSTFPFGTLSVNIIGCLLIGIVYGFADKGSLSNDWRLFIATGVLGGFTTFSAFSHESVTMLRDGQLGYAFAYIAASIILGLLATYGGILLVQRF